MPIPTDFVNIDTSPKPCKCALITRHAVELLQALTLAAFIYSAAVFCFSL